MSNAQYGTFFARWRLLLGYLQTPSPGQDGIEAPLMPVAKIFPVVVVVVPELSSLVGNDAVEESKIRAPVVPPNYS